MKIGYNKPLYVLPLDHRHSYITGEIFNFSLPISEEQKGAIVDSKHLIYEGFKQALADGVSKADAGILVDEEFGTSILRDADANGIITAISTEKSGSEEFEFEYGEDFARHIEAFDPTFAKVLVRYNPEGDPAMNNRQMIRLNQLSGYCRKTNRRFMFELLVPATAEQLERVGQDKNRYDLEIRPKLMAQTILDLQDADVEPDVWKVEGLDRRSDCQRIVETARRDGREDVGIIVLGRGADENKVVNWLKTAAGVPGFIGFAVGRTSFWDAVADFESKKATRAEAVARIAKRYREWVNIFQQGSRTLPVK